MSGGDGRPPTGRKGTDETAVHRIAGLRHCRSVARRPDRHMDDGLGQVACGGGNRHFTLHGLSTFPGRDPAGGPPPHERVRAPAPRRGRSRRAGSHAGMDGTKGGGDGQWERPRRPGGGRTRARGNACDAGNPAAALLIVSEGKPPRTGGGHSDGRTGSGHTIGSARGAGLIVHPAGPIDVNAIFGTPLPVALKPPQSTPSSAPIE